MAAQDALAGPHLTRPRIYSTGPFWPGLVASALVAGAMLPWIYADYTVEVGIPWIKSWTLTPGVPVWVLAAAGFVAFLSSIRCRVRIDERARTITYWRCIGVFIPWAMETRPFEDVRVIWMGVEGGSSLGEEGDSFSTETISVYILFHNRDRMLVGDGSERRMVALCEELCALFGVRRV